MLSLEERRQLGVYRRLGPLLQYFFLDALANGCFSVPMALFIAVRVLDNNPQRIAMFAMLSILVYQVPRIPMAVIHGEVADRMPRIGLMYASKVINIILNLLIVTYPDVTFVLAIYFLQACLNVHSFSEHNYFMDLTMHGPEDARCSICEQPPVQLCTNYEPWLMTRTIKADKGIQDIQQGGIAVGVCSAIGRVIGQVAGTLLVRQKVLTIQLAIHIALIIKFLAQFTLLFVSETKPRLGDDPGFFMLLGFAVKNAPNSIYTGWEEQRTRWQAREKILNNLTVFAIVFLFTVFFYGTLFLLMLEYKLRPSKQQRIDISLTLIPSGVVGFVAWYYHYSSREKGEIFVTPYYMFAITCVMAMGAFVNTHMGFLGVMAIFTCCMIPVVVPTSAMWPSQAPIQKQGRLKAVSVVFFLTLIVVPSILLGGFTFMFLAGRFGPLGRYRSGSRSAKHDRRSSFALLITSIASVPAIVCLLKISTEVRLLTGATASWRFNHPSQSINS